MPYTSEWIDPEVFLEHNGVTVYHVYKDNELDQGARTYWFTTCPDDGDDRHYFDVRELPAPPEGPSFKDAPTKFLSIPGEILKRHPMTLDRFEAMTRNRPLPSHIPPHDYNAARAEWEASAEYARRERKLDAWTSKGQDEAIRNTLRHAIDAEILKQTED